MLQSVGSELDLRIERVMIDGSAELEALHGSDVPVVFIGDRKLFKYRVDLARLRRHLARTRRSALPLAITLLLPLTLTASPAAETRLIELINLDRARVSLPPVAASDKAAAIARTHADEMMRAGRIYHDSPAGWSLKDRLRDFPALFEKSGENVARGFDVDMIHAGLMNSTGHRKNILDPEYTHVGIGVERDASGTLFVAQVFLQIMTVRTPDEIAAEMLDRVQHARRAAQRDAMRHDAVLSEEATRMARSMFERDSKEPGDLSSQLSQGYVKIACFVGQQPSWKMIDELVRHDWEAVGCGGFQGKTKSWPNGATWYVLLLYSTTRP